MTTPRSRLGARLLPGGGTLFATFAQGERCTVQVVDSEQQLLAEHELEAQGEGYFAAAVPTVSEGALYFFSVDGRRLPDPYARYLPQGVHGPAEVRAAQRPQQPLPARRLSELVIYEIHIGTFTPEGTFEAARQRLPELAKLGVTCVELMPIAAFAGERGWGYDGVALYAPHAPYGTPEDLRHLVEAAHELGLSVLLDVVYNHFGPSGNYLTAYSPRYFSESLHNAWGQAPSFEEPALRALVLENARYWLEELGFDGLRLDATHAILDPSPKHVLAELAELAHGLTPPRLLIAEDERNRADLVTTVGLDALWADDFHHQVRVTLTGESHGYYGAFVPGAEGIAQTLNQGWLYTGQMNPVSKEPRGTPADALEAPALAYCIQNHDQIGNRPFGDRLPLDDAYRAASLLLLFLPMTPLLFMGQEWGSSTPFQYFTDHDAELGRLVSEGRRREFAAFPDFSDPERQLKIPDPQDVATFRRSKLQWAERELPEQARTLELYRSALRLRAADPVLTQSSRRELRANELDGALVVRRWVGSAQRVLIMNLSAEALTISGLAERLGLESARALLRSDGAAGDALPPWTTVVLAAEGALEGPPEGNP
ncbi:MAG: malto-oligosyltrehalose trehalohydrolase [Myxococcales bacterium]|nr:MAG: malto-oligosyltrehalose trehalohydrolase [Myxococcales bacterium]